MKYLAILSIVVSLALGFTPESFRLQSTAGIWEDDYDLIFDPGRLPLIEGQRIYTNLSNYVTGNEAQFGLNSSNFILVGASGRIKDKLAPAAIFDGHDYKLPQFTGLFSADSLDSLFGSARSVYVRWQDLDTNGTYDFKQVRITERNAWQSGLGSDLYLGLGYKSDKSRFGLAFAWSDTCLKHVLPGLDYIYHNYDSSLVAGQLTFLRDDTAHYSDQYRAGRLRLALSTWLDLNGGSTLGIGLAPALLNDNATLDRTLWSYINHNPGSPNVADFEKATINDASKLPYQGLQVPLSLTLVSLFGEHNESWLYAQGFWQSEQVSSSAADQFASTFAQTLNPGDSFGFDSLAHKFQGARSSYGGSLRVRELYQIGERFDLGWSLQLGVRAYSDSLLDAMGETSRTSYDNGDSIQNRSDWTRTTTLADLWLTRITGRQAVLTVPVGLEFKIVPSACIRLGAIHTVTLDDSKNTQQLLSFAPRKVRMDYGDGTFSEAVDPAQRRPATSETASSLRQNTTFTYGAGFRPVENLQLDLMGFANLTNLTGWRLSATFRF